MSSSFAGCVHLSSVSSSPQPPCDSEVLILIYTAEKRAFLGLIPYDRATFVDHFKRVIHAMYHQGQTGQASDVMAPGSPQYNPQTPLAVSLQNPVGQQQRHHINNNMGVVTQQGGQTMGQMQSVQNQQQRAHGQARCRGCERIFCCCKHRKEHQLACETFKIKLAMGSNRNPSIYPAPRASGQVNSPLLRRLYRKEEETLSSGKKKRKHEQLGSPFSRPSAFSMYSFLNPSHRMFKKAVRGKFKKIQKVPTLEPVKEEDEGKGPEQGGLKQKGKTILVNGRCELKPQTCDPYSDFVVGSLKDSPITVIPRGLLIKDKDDLATPTTSSGSGNTLNDIFKTSTPDDYSPFLEGFTVQPGKTPLLKVRFGSQTPHLVTNLKASTPDETFYSSAGIATDSMVEETDQDCDAGITSPTKEQLVQCTPIHVQPRRRVKCISARSSSGSSGSSVYHSACSTFSPLALNSHSCTPVTIPSLVTSEEDVFRTFSLRLPGARNDTQANGFSPPDSSLTLQ